MMSAICPNCGEVRNVRLNGIWHLTDGCFTFTIVEEEE